MTNDGVEIDMGLRVPTVKTYRNCAFDRLGIHFQNGLFPPAFGRASIYRRLRRMTIRVDSANSAVRMIMPHSDSVGIPPPESGTPGPPASGITLFANRSSSPTPPSVMVNVTVLPENTA